MVQVFLIVSHQAKACFIIIKICCIKSTIRGFILNFVADGNYFSYFAVD